MARAIFSVIKRKDPEVFVVKIAGHLGQAERGSVDELLRKCDEKNKSKVAFELSELESLGGGVAKMIGEFVIGRAEGGLTPIFVSASDTVRAFLNARCSGGALEFMGAIEEAEAYFVSGELPGGDNADGAEPGAAKEDARAKVVPPEEAPKKASAKSAAKKPAAATDDETPTKGKGRAKPKAPEAGSARGSEKDLSGPVIQLPDQSEEPAPKSGQELRILELDKLAPDARYLSLAEAEQAFAAASDLAGMKGAVGALLYGVDLASDVHLMTRQGDMLVEVGEEPRSFSAKGVTARQLLSINTPVPMVDLGGIDVDELEAQLLTEFNCQMAVPIVVKDRLEGALFLRKALAGSEYEPSEVLALDLLGRKLAHALDPALSSLTASDSSKGNGKGVDGAAKELGRKVHQQKALFNIAKEFNTTRDEDHLINLVLLTTIAQVGVGHVAYFELEKNELKPKKNRGLDEVSLSEIEVEDREALIAMTSPVGVEDGSVDELNALFGRMEGFGFQTIAPLRSKSQFFGLLTLGPRLSGGREGGVDLEFLSILINQAGVALESARLFRDLHNRTLGVAQTFVNLIEKRSGPDARASTELISHYVGRVAQKISYPSDQIRDLIYGTVLRDIGMIEISDLVLRSPRSLTPEEWKLIKQHPITGVEILSAMDFSETITDVVLYHHERFNGEGYPHGLRGAAIPLGARIVSAVEAFVAMTRDLPYRAALSRAEGLEVMRENWGMRYDPEVLAAFLQIVEAEGDEEPTVAELIEVS